MTPKIKISKSQIKFILIYIGVFILGFALTYSILSYSKIFKNFTHATSGTPGAQSDINFAPANNVENEKGVYDTVLLGYGGAGHAGSLLTDSIIVVHVNTNTKTAALISIPRDLWVNGNHKINAEASINGFQNEGGVIKNVTGLNINYFVAVDFSGFEKLIDNLGGIAVDVPKTFDDYFYPIAGAENDTCGKTAEEIIALKAKYSDAALEMQFTCRYEHIHFDKGPVNLDGTTALKFVRSRHGDSDFGRSERQFAVLKGILAKLISLHALDKTAGTINILLSIIRTNLNPEQIGSLLEVVGDTGQYKITEIHLTTDNLLNEGKSADGAYILYPKAGMFNFTDIRNYISQNI
jgi:LCP family protein required for cell wall assembly